MIESSSFIRPARPDEIEALEALLREARLPLEGFRDHLRDTLVAIEDGRVVGGVALERYGAVALLRSLVVSPDRRGRGLGERLTAEALGLARRMGVRDLYLLTETAEGFFPRFGFRVEERTAAPEALAASAEFQTACPASAVMMHLKLDGPGESSAGME